jgi:hypothetical protein
VNNYVYNGISRVTIIARWKIHGMSTRFIAIIARRSFITCIDCKLANRENIALTKLMGALFFFKFSCELWILRYITALWRYHYYYFVGHMLWIGPVLANLQIHETNERDTFNPFARLMARSGLKTRSTRSTLMKENAPFVPELQT